MLASLARGARSQFIVAGVLLILLPIWAFGMLGRTLWTPDEPREADIAWRMSQQHDRAVPELAGKPILEKPPLTYWLSGAAVSIAGLHPAVLRVPNLLYAALATASIVLLALQLAGARGAWIAGLASGSFLLAFQVSIWLATDAAVVAGAGLALFAAYRALESQRGIQKLGAYALMCAGLTIGFMAKGPIALLVPGCAFAGAVVWNKRWAELGYWEFWLPTALPIAACGAWILSVLHGSGGSGNLQTLFWWNLVGRFVHLPAPPDVQFAEGHQNWPGKYLVQGAVYVFPWTFLCVAAARRAWHALRAEAGAALPWRFLTAGIAGPLLVLTIAATARDIYAAPILLPVAALIGLWAQTQLNAPDAFERRMLRWTLVGCAAFAAVLVVATSMFVAAFGVTPLELFCFVLELTAALTVIAGWRRQKNALPWAAAKYAFASGLVSLLALAALLPQLNGAQDLSRIGTALARDVGDNELVLYVPDETTLAFVDMSFTSRGKHFRVIESADAVLPFLRDQPDSKILLKLAGTSRGPLMARLPHRPEAPARTANATRSLALVRALSAGQARVYALPDGRRYALISRSGASQSAEALNSETLESFRDAGSELP